MLQIIKNKTGYPKVCKIIVTACILLWSLTAQAQQTNRMVPTKTPAPGPCSQAITAASQANQYMFVFFWKANDHSTDAMYKVFQTAMKNNVQGVSSMSVKITDKKENDVVKKFGLDRAPMPFVLAIAPNGAITGSWALKITEEQLQSGIVSTATASALKSMQSRRLAFLCLYHPKKDKSLPVFQGVKDFAADKRYGNATDVIMVNIEDPTEAAFLKTLNIDPEKTTDSSVLLAPPGAMVGQFHISTGKENIISKLQAAKSNPCAGGSCGPGGCCPK